MEQFACLILAPPVSEKCLENLELVSTGACGNCAESCKGGHARQSLASRLSPGVGAGEGAGRNLGHLWECLSPELQQECAPRIGPWYCDATSQCPVGLPHPSAHHGCIR